MAENEIPAEIRVGPQGRVVIPAALRRALDFHAGDRLIVRKEDGRLIFEKTSTIARRLKARFKHIAEHEQLADELIGERRAEAHRKQKN